MKTEDLVAAGLEIGFSGVGVCPWSAPVHHTFYQMWLENGFGADMDYLSRHLELKKSPRELLPSCESVIAVTLDYNQTVEQKTGEVKIARYALGRDYHKVLKRMLKRLEQVIQKSYPSAQFRACVDSTPILEREYAQQAGLGWFGKNSCLIDSRRGSWFFIGLLLTSEVFEQTTPAIGGCGTCTRCIEACPTGAIVFQNGRWQVDSRICISYLTIEKRGEIAPDLAENLSGWTFGCDVCQEVCPFNEIRESQPSRGARATEPDLLSHRKWPSLQDLESIGEEEWDLLTRGSAVRRVGWAGLKRNARLNLIHLPQIQ